MQNEVKIKMFSNNKLYCRCFQSAFNIGAKLMKWRKPILVDGQKSIEKTPEILKKEGVKKPLLVAGKRLMTSDAGVTLLKGLEERKIEYALFDGVTPNPSIKVIEDIFSKYKEEKCDGFLAIGGGSYIDAAKAAAARVVRPNKSIEQLGGLLKVGKNIPTFIAVPTTAGTGSETTIAAVVTNTETHHKYSIMDLHLIPKYAILDPDLTVGLPPFLTATTGMDALTHAIEAFLCWTLYTKESRRFAKEATASIINNIEKAFNDGADINARSEMLIASFKAGFAFTRSGVGNVHAIAHTLGGLYDTAHGLANAVILPIVLEDYGDKIYPELAELAEISGVANEGTTSEKAKKFIEKIYELNASMNLPKNFDFIKDEDIPTMVKWATKEANPVYPVPVVYDEKRFEAVIKKVRGV